MTSHGARGGAVSASVGPYPGRFQGVRCFSRLEKVKLVSAASISDGKIAKSLGGISESHYQIHFKKWYSLSTTDSRCSPLLSIQQEFTEKLWMQLNTSLFSPVQQF